MSNTAAKFLQIPWGPFQAGLSQSLFKALLRWDDEETVSGPVRLFRRACIHDTLHQPVPRHQDHLAPGPALKRHTALPPSPAE
nr:uncharacterized protein LOC105347653 isoform X2 [Crassostrea gigas]